jgi:hypothetical protein
MTGARRKRLLLAELEDRMAIALFTRLYEHERIHDVLLSRTADVTNALLETDRFHVVVIRAHTSKPGDIAQLEARLRRSGGARILALIDSEVNASAAMLYAAGADSVRQVSTPIAELAVEINRVAQTDTLLEGRLEQMGAPELIQTLCLCRRSLMIRMETSGGRCAVWIANGEIQHAVSDGLSGQSAMTAIVRADSGRFWASTGGPLPVRTIHHDWQFVLLEAAREGDEAAQQSSAQVKPRPGPSASQSQVRNKLGKTYRELTELGLNAIKSGEFSKAREYWDAARSIGPDDEDPKSVVSAPQSPVVAPPKRVERG